MALKISDECINCDVCEPACPNDAISMGENYYVINPDLCTECVGHHDEPQCQLLCPVECIDIGIKETSDTLLKRFHKLQD